MKHVLLAALAACASCPALADVTYSYTGRPLHADSAPPGSDPAADSAPLSITLEFSDDGSSLLDWSLSQPEMGTIDPSNAVLTDGAFGAAPSFYLFTDAAGAVTAWYVTVQAIPPAGGGASQALHPTGVQSFYGVVLGTPPLPYGLYALEAAEAAPGDPGLNDYYYVGANHNDPGVWTSSGGRLPDLVFGNPADLTRLAVPEPAGGMLLLAGAGLLVGFAGRPRRQISRNAASTS